MVKPEFDEFYYYPENAIVEFKDALNSEKSDLLDIYNKDLLYCPECYMTFTNDNRNGHLKFTSKSNKRKAFLSLRPSSQHDEDCSHYFEKISKSQATMYYQNLTDSQIRDKLNAIINKYLRQIEPPATDDEESEYYRKHPNIAKIRVNTNYVHKRLPTRSIYSIYDIEEDELNIPIMLYGVVRLNVAEFTSASGFTYYRLFINDLDNNFIRYIYRGSTKDDIDNESVYYIAMIVVYSKNPKGRTHNIELYNQNSIMFIKQ